MQQLSNITYALFMCPSLSTSFTLTDPCWSQFSLVSCGCPTGFIPNILMQVVDCLFHGTQRNIQRSRWQNAHASRQKFGIPRPNLPLLYRKNSLWFWLWPQLLHIHTCIHISTSSSDCTDIAGAALLSSMEGFFKQWPEMLRERQR
jgi:hypothetical protein